MKLKILLPLLAGLALAGCTKKLEEENSALKQSVEVEKSKGQEAAIQLAKLRAENDAVQSRLADLQKSAASAAAAFSEKEAGWRARESEIRSEVARLRAEAAGLQAELKNARDSAAQIAQQNERGELVGTVNYFFNSNYGFKPDSGSTIFIFTKDVAPDFDPKLLARYHELIDKAELGNAEVKEMSAKLLTSILPVLGGGKSLQLSTDGNGAFRTKLKPGRYSVLVRSGHRKAISVVEISGQLEYREIEIKAGDQTNIDAKFYP